MTDADTLLAKKRLLEQKIALQHGLPHLYGWKFYPWARTFFESKNKITLLSKANQISGSSTQIRKFIHWATAPDLWPTLWPKAPRQFWYLYPTRDVAHVEWKKKWEPDFMPRDEFKSHPVYGWQPEYYHGRIFAIHFNSGVSGYFKTYSQNVEDLQTGSVDYEALDEEPEEEIMGELLMRLAGTQGYMSAVFTPTKGQQYWYEAMEVRGKGERFPNACKQIVSMYDCLKYEDGSPSFWTPEVIEIAKASCKSEAEIQRRIYGRFVPDENRKYPSYNPVKNRKPMPPHFPPKDWMVYVGVDPGSGGDDGHPSAITCTAVSPDYTKARVFRGWRGDGEVTTAGIVVDKVIEMTKGMNVVDIRYDWGCADFKNIAEGMGLTVSPAEKRHDIGEQVINVLFKNEMCFVYELPELDALSRELITIKKSGNKRDAKDDFADSFRYSVAAVPFDWSVITAHKPEPDKPPKEMTHLEWVDQRRRGNLDEIDQAHMRLHSVEDEFTLINELLHG